MLSKETVSQADLLHVLSLLDSLNMKYWIDGGWGVDILLGKQSREHRDIDVDFDGLFTEALLAMLEKAGYVVTTDWRPSRIELHSPVYGYIDIHPLVLEESGKARQDTPDGGWYDFEPDYFSEVVFAGRRIPCISLKAQKLFHSGYELREADRHDIKILEDIPAQAENG